MRKVKFILLGLGAAFAISAMATASASALSDLYFEQPSKALTTTEKVEGSVGIAQFQSTILSAKILIECTTNTFTGEIGPGGKSAGAIEYTKCKLYSIKEGKKEDLTATCPVGEPIRFEFIDQLITQSKAGVVADEFLPKNPPVFVKLKIGGASCTLTFKTVMEFKVEGTYTASLGDQAEEDETEHELVFNEAGGNVKFESKE